MGYSQQSIAFAVFSVPRLPVDDTAIRRFPALTSAAAVRSWEPTAGRRDRRQAVTLI